MAEFIGVYYAQSRGRRVAVASIKEGSTMTHFTKGALIEKIRVYNEALVALHVREEEEKGGESGADQGDRQVPSDD